MPPASARALLLPSPFPPSGRTIPAVSPLLRVPNRHHARLRLSSASPRPFRCSAASVAEAASPAGGVVLAAGPVKPSFAEVARTVMELSSTGTLSAVAPDGWPLGVGARFVVDMDGSPAICLKNIEAGRFSVGGKSSFHVQLEQSGLRTPQCTLLGSLTKPEHGLLLKDLQRKWERRFAEELDEEFIYLVSVERVLCIADFNEDGIWVNSVEYGNAEPDPLRNCAEKIVHEMNTEHSEDVQRLSSAHVETEFQVVDSKMIWVDRLGFDLYLYSEKEVFEARIPFPREVTDEKGVKSTFNSMSHQAWEVEKNYALPESQKVKILKKVGQTVLCS
ncbi:unnamed protein product [Spirodela intermedia]|uniref:DUF2470 domain-containing protein n=1 Tax=Spirodela intermedia TaxID=51605 RepID=A0A7I8LBZ9_SPIIN|nr:unnamed protein product [Spirodela intermedia]